MNEWVQAIVIIFPVSFLVRREHLLISYHLSDFCIPAFFIGEQRYTTLVCNISLNFYAYDSSSFAEVNN